MTAHRTISVDIIDTMLGTEKGAGCQYAVVRLAQESSTHKG